MNVTTFLGHLFRSHISRIATVLLIVLSCNIPAFCGAIHDAAKAGDLAKVKTLLEDYPMMVSLKDKNGYTPLHLAALNGHKDVVELLLAKGADIDARNKEGKTPLQRALKSDNYELGDILLAHGAKE
jgi:uncharacterized protein